MAAVPSPSKKLATWTPSDSSLREPGSLRGSFAEASRTVFEDAVKERAMRARQVVGRGPATFEALPVRARLGVTQSLPVLPFAVNSVYTLPIFETSQDQFRSAARQLSGTFKRPNELRPMWDVVASPDDDRSTTSGSESLKFTIDSDGYRTRETTEDLLIGGKDDEQGDGFDLDEVFGAESNNPFQSINEDSQESTTTTATITGRMKRAYEESVVARDDDDMLMDATDDENEADVDNEPVAVLPGLKSEARVFVGNSRRSALMKTKSLPASVFSSTMF